MKKRKLLIFVFLIFSVSAGKIYASCFSSHFNAVKIEFNKSFQFATTHDFCFRAKVQSLPLYLVFPDMDIRDEGNRPIRDYKNLFLDIRNNQYEIFNVWGIIKKKSRFKNIRLQLVNLNKLQIRSSQKNTKHFFITLLIFEEVDLSLKYSTFLC
ncbi:hypothetical protein KAU39_00760 [bacterium]|nr:hypothetical protein [bacterium]